MPKMRLKKHKSDIIVDGLEISRQYKKRFGSPDKFIDNNYGIEYKTTGGGSRKTKRGGGSIKESLYDFVGKFVDNRVLDVYLKYLGITTLSPATLVPIALIFGQQSFEDVVKHFKKKREQSGGKRNIPVIDNNVVGPYLKIAGLTALSLSLDTLVPLGLVMAIWHAVQKHDTKKKQQTGGGIGKLIAGTNVPPGNLQLSMKYWDGQTVQNNMGRPLTGFQQLSRPLSYVNQDGLSSSCDSGCSANSFQTNKDIQAYSYGFPEPDIGIQPSTNPVKPYDSSSHSSLSVSSLSSLSEPPRPIFNSMA